MTKMTCIIVDDEILARTIIKKYLVDFRDIEVIAECSDGFDAAQVIQKLHPDFIFLDVQMPKISGLEMLELIENPPLVIFTTAFQEHAVQAFEMNAIDYLLKPFSQQRFTQALAKLNNNLSTRDEQKNKLTQFLKDSPYQMPPIGRIVVKTVNAIKVIPVKEVLYIETQDDYVMLYTKEGKFLKQQTLKYLEKVLDPTNFIRIHRSFLVNVNEIARIEPGEKLSYQMILKNGTTLPISRSGYSLLRETLDF